MYSDHVISQQEHEKWFQKVMKDENTKCLIFEVKGRPVGFVSFTEISYLHSRCYWAFYVGDSDVPRGTGSSMEFFALQHAFEVMMIRKLCCEVFEFNSSVVKMHEKFGFTKEGILKSHHLKNGKHEDIGLLAMFSDTWEKNRANLKIRCFGKNA